MYHNTLHYITSTCKPTHFYPQTRFSEVITKLLKLFHCQFPTLVWSKEVEREGITEALVHRPCNGMVLVSGTHCSATLHDLTHLHKERGGERDRRVSGYIT